MGINFGPSDLGNRDETLYNGLLLSQNNSNLHQNPLNGNGLISSHQLNQLLHHQNNQFISQRIYQPSNIGLNGHIGLGQVVTEVRRTFVTLTPNRVQVHSFIDYSPIQNQLAFPPKEVIIGISEVTKTTRFLAPTSTTERLLAPNYNLPTQDLLQNSTASIQGLVANDKGYVQRLTATNRFDIQGQLPNFRNQTLVSTNSVYHPIPEIDHFLNPHDQNRPLNLRTPRIIDLDDHVEASAYGDRVVTTLAKGKAHVQDKNPGKNPNNIQNPNPEENQDVEYDGRIHSHPCKKYGPYKCSKCNGAFGTSEAFAAHMRSHYKYETRAERKRRLSARLKKRNLRLVHSTEGLTMMPQPSNEQMRVKARKRNGHGEAYSSVEIEVEVEKHANNAHSPNVETSNSDMKKIKEEIVEENFFGEVKIKKEPM